MIQLTTLHDQNTDHSVIAGHAQAATDHSTLISDCCSVVVQLVKRESFKTSSVVQ